MQAVTTVHFDLELREKLNKMAHQMVCHGHMVILRVMHDKRQFPE